MPPEVVHSEHVPFAANVLHSLAVVIKVPTVQRPGVVGKLQFCVGGQKAYKPLLKQELHVNWAVPRFGNSIRMTKKSITGINMFCQ